MSDELEQDQSIVVWATPIYHRKLKLQEQKDIKTLLEPFITDDVLDQNAFNLSKQKSSIRNPKNAELPWDQFLAYLRPYIDDFYKLDVGRGMIDLDDVESVFGPDIARARFQTPQAFPS